MKRSASSDGGAERGGGGALQNKLVFRPLGSGREVGRSCHILEFMGKRIMLDCGIHPGRRGQDALPFFGSIDGPIDLVLVTHFHLDHIAGLPYLTERSSYGPQIKHIYMTKPTKSVASMLLCDYVRVGGQTDQDVLYDEADVLRCLSKCRAIDFHQEIQVDGINIACYNAGHVLGACMFMIEIGGVRILYTGDYSREDDRHLRGAEIPHIHPDVLIVESTFGVQTHESRLSREERFTSAIHSVVKRGGRCLLPVFSLGRAQELCLILEDFWSKHPELQGVPIYHVSKLASKSLEVYKGYSTYMNERITKAAANPWNFNYISGYSNNEFNEMGAAVVMASPGMLQNGPSRKFFEQWCSDKRNGVVLAGYCVEGTLAKEIMNDSVKEINSLSGRKLPLNCEVKNISFAAHSDFVGTFTFLQQVLPKYVILVHGEEQQMKRLRDELVIKCKIRPTMRSMAFFNPDNGENVDLSFRRKRIVRVLGRLAEELDRNMAMTGGQQETGGEGMHGSVLSGVLVRRNFDEQLLHPADVHSFTQLTTTVIMQRLHVPFHSPMARLRSSLAQLFEPEEVWAADCDKDDETRSAAASTNQLKIHGIVTLTHSGHNVLMEWPSSPSNDTLADAIVALLMQADGGVPAVRDSSCCSTHHGGSSEPATTASIGAEDNDADDSVAVPLELQSSGLNKNTKSIGVVLQSLAIDRYGADRVRFDSVTGTLEVLAEAKVGKGGEDRDQEREVIARVNVEARTVDALERSAREQMVELLRWSERTLNPVPLLPPR